MLSTTMKLKSQNDVRKEKKRRKREYHEAKNP
jgi:hypothetical protein